MVASMRFAFAFAFAVGLLALAAAPRAAFADCVTPCRAYLCPTTSDVGPLVEATVLGPQDFGYRIEITAVHGGTRQGLVVRDEVYMEPKFGLAFAAGDDVLAHTGRFVDEVVGFALVDASDRVSCAPLTYDNEDFTIGRGALIEAIEDGTCLQALDARGYETPRCDDTSEGCAVGGGGDATPPALLLIVIGSAALARRRPAPSAARSSAPRDRLSARSARDNARW